MSLPNNKKDLVAAQKVQFHKSWLNAIKRSIGSDCRYISHLKNGDDYFIKAILLNKEGGKDTLRIKLSINPSALTSKDYQALLKTLKNREYEQGSTEALPTP